MSTYSPSSTRYDQMPYNRSGRSGLKLPALSLGLWHNFGDIDDLDVARKIILKAFDHGITHFDLANNYGPPGGSAEINFGKILNHNLKPYRDELIISTKAGYGMWPGPYGEWGSRKYMLASLDQSLKRVEIDYVDIFYSHRFDPETPLEETMTALSDAVKSGKALYAGISNYPAEASQKAFQLLRELGTPCLIHQARYSMLDRWVESELLDLLEAEGVGCIAYSPLAQGLLTDRYLKGIPADSRAAREVFLTKEQVDQVYQKIVRLNQIAQNRNQSLAQMALAWLLKDDRITSVLVGASSVQQLDNNVKSLENTAFSNEELKKIEELL
ncbi:MAG: L-glyceraldehyde 3-phosphate reductase [Bacteroidetes bacterium]|nr:L-glyceraldehyde 3-phosphate reductase [Bacteroidota bacterium]MBU1577909.1 L-glyceraldehyde 3-phosphate reductase [Bacteroidota bacterium]MBU2558722.1 L-glyceraldehyde 3-phosphate reductase [Bacteroidota bacterium]